MSAFKVHELLAEPTMKAKLGTSLKEGWILSNNDFHLIILELYIRWLGGLYSWPSMNTWMVLNGKFSCKVRPVAEMIKSASTLSPFAISIPVSVNVSMCPVAIVALPFLAGDITIRFIFFLNPPPNWIKEVSPRSKAEPLVQGVVGWVEVLLEIIPRHRAFHLLEHPPLDQPLGVIWKSFVDRS